MDRFVRQSKAPQNPPFQFEVKETATGDMPVMTSEYVNVCVTGEHNEINFPLCVNMSDEEWLQWRSEVQAGSATDEESPPVSEFIKLLRTVRPKLTRMFESFDIEPFFVNRMLENFTILQYAIRHCKTFNDYYVCFLIAYRLFTGKPASVWVAQTLERVFSSEVQGSDLESTLGILRNLFDCTSSVTDSELSKKLVRVYSFLLTQGYLSGLGIVLTDEDYSKLEQRAYIAGFSSKKSFAWCVADTCLFICERVVEWRKCGDASVFLRSGKSHDEWNRTADRLLSLAPFTGNLAPHGTSYFSFIADLRNAIEEGEAICKYVRSRSGEDSRFISQKLSKLQFVSNTEITKRSSQLERAAPFGVLIHGGSSVAKTAFAKMLFHYYGALRGLDHSDHFRFVRSPTDEFWTNYDSSKWCVQFDDLAFLHPKNGEMEPGLKDMLHVAGNTPFNPPQAALEDKGKTPVLCELVTATTNCVDLNALEYFWCPLAIRRRLPFVVSVEPKAEFSHANGHFIDPAKLRTENGKYPDYWVIKLMKIVPEERDNRQNATLEEVRTFTDVNIFLQHYGKAIEEHNKHQALALAKDKDMKDVEVCRRCYAPLPHEECLEMQSQDMRDYYIRVKLFCEYLLVYRYCLLFFVPYLPWSYAWKCFSWVWRGYVAFFFQLGLAMYLFFPRWIVTRLVESLVERQVSLWLITNVSRWKLGRRCVMKLANSSDSENSQSILLKFIFEAENRQVVKLVSILSALSVVLCLCMNYGGSRKAQDAPKDVECTVQSAESDQFEKEAASNVWYNPTVELTTFDMPVASTSLANMDGEGVRSLLQKNCVLLHIRGRGDNYKRVIRGVMLAGHKCMTNAHAFRGGVDWFTITVVSSNNTSGVGGNMSFELHSTMVARSDKTDLCIFDVECLPPFRDVLKYWPDTDHMPTSCVQLLRSDDGSSVRKRNVYNLTFVPQMPIEELGKYCDVFLGTCDEETMIGECGALSVVCTGKGPYILGLHVLGRENRAGILRVRKQEIQSLLLHEAISKRPIVQAGFMPTMEVASRKHILGPLHHRSMVRYIESGAVRTYGSFVGFRPKPKSKVCGTPLQSIFLSHYNREVEYGPPAMAGWEPWKNNLAAMTRPKSLFDRRILRECSKAFAADCLAGLCEKDLGELVELSNRAAVNGLPEVKYIDKINNNTSMGFPWCKTKKEFLIKAPDDEYPEGIDFGPEVWAEVAKVEAAYADGRRANPIFVGSLKDEATPFRKIKAKKTRLFMGGPIAWGIVVRKQLLTFVRLVQRNRNLFECSVGLPAQGKAWGELRDHLTRFGVSRMVAGDYAFFDKEMLAEFILECFSAIIDIMRAAGVSESRLITIMCIGEDIAFSLCNVNGDLFEFLGSNPSGQNLTVIVNSIVNALYLRYAYHVLNPAREVVSFKCNVVVTTYGDDNVFGVSVLAPWYNHTTVQTALAGIGITYTMADKMSVSVAYIHIDEVTFLKRRWRWDEDVGHFLCPLDEESIIKSLTVWKPSDTLDEYAHMLRVIAAANDEYFFYGKQTFEEKRSFFLEVLAEEPYRFYAETQPLPTYDQLVVRFLGVHTPAGLTTSTGQENKSPPVLNQRLANSKFEESTCGSGTVETVTARTVHPMEQKVAPWDKNETLCLQSSDIQDLPVEGGTETSEVVTFVDNSTGQISDTPYVYSGIASSGGTLNTSLEHFLRRPTLIDTRNWTTATSNGVLGSSIEPWFLYLNNAVIRNKLNNYAFLRAKLCVKVIINATPFHYGCMRVAYEPNVNVAGTGSRTTKIRTNPVSSLPLIAPYSQLPGAWVLPADNSGGEIHVPFFRHTNWLPLRNANDVRSMGVLTYYVAFPLTVASATGSSSVSISTFAWLEDVELGGATAELTLQARDEYDGVISAPAKAVSTAAAALASVPVIGKFAKATSIGAGAIANMAGLFGFTNTPVIDNVHAVVPVVGVHLATSEIGTPVQKLALDPKQELSIDPGMHGLDGEDQMSIDYIAKKRSTLVMGGWSTSDSVGAVLYNARVSPMLFGRVEILDAGLVSRANRVYHTPMSYLGMMFTHWKGDIIFEIEIICTKFHKGRLKIAWDPIGSGGTVALPENTVYTTILDIGENNKATFRVPFHQAFAWQRLRGIANDNWTPGNTLNTDPVFDNGLLIVSVLTPLMSPVSPQNVGVKVSVYSATVEYANPSSYLGDTSTTAPPSFFAVQARDELDVEASVVTLGDNGVMHPERYCLNFGERIASLRTLLHRHSLYDTSSVGADVATRTVLYRKSYSRHPPMFGYDPAGWTSLNRLLTGGTSFGTVAPTHPITYVEMMYGGSTGGINFVVNTSADLFPYVGDVRIQRLTDTSRNGDRNGVVAATINAGTTTGAYNRFMNMSVPSSGTAGAAFTNTITNGSINFNYPMMTGVNFNYTDPTTYQVGNPADQTNRECVSMEVYVKQAVASSVTGVLTFTTYAGTGVDYNCLWWLCCPTLDYYSAIPTAP